MKNTLLLLSALIATVLGGGTFKTPICVELDEPLTVTSEGTSKIILQGQITGGDSFHVFLRDGWSNSCSIPYTHNNIAFAINPRVAQNHVATNSYANDTTSCIKTCNAGWGSEGQKSDTPFAIGTPFELVITCETNFFQVFLNGKHLLSFPYQIKLQQVTHLQVVGSASFRKIDILRPIFDSNTASTYNCDQSI